MPDASQQFKEWGPYAVPPERDVGAALAALSEEDLPAPRSTSGIATRANRGRLHRRHGPSTNCRTC
jgi:hypothetical protein